MDPRERFLTAAVEPLADNAELQMAARQQLEEQLSPEATDEELVGAAERLERSGRGRWALGVGGGGAGGVAGDDGGAGGEFGRGLA